jgi:hypothetical protein
MFPFLKLYIVFLHSLDQAPRGHLVVSPENFGYYTWVGGAVTIGLKPGMLLKLFRCTAQFTTYHKCHIGKDDKDD